MEQFQAQQWSLAVLVNSLPSSNLNLIVSYLDYEAIDNIIRPIPKRFLNCKPFISLLTIRHFLQNYVIKTDRSMYMAFYSEKSFLKIEYQQISHLCNHSAPVLTFLNTSFNDLFIKLQQELSSFNLCQDLIDSIKESLTDPQLPFPKLRKQNIGRHCNSAFQYHLVDQLFSTDDEDFLEETFEQLRNFMSGSLESCQNKGQHQIEIIQKMYREWYTVSHQNYEQFLIPENRNHNLIVLLIALIDILIDTFHFYVDSIQDPLHAFIEFNMRYCIFRNVILSLQDKLSFLFKSYSQFCKDLLVKSKLSEEQMQIQEKDEGENDDQMREMTIWHCALSKWYLFMQQHHDQYSRTFFYLLRKTNFAVIKESIHQKLNQSSVFIQLMNRLEFTEINQLSKEKYSQIYSPIQNYFQKDITLYRQLIKQYAEYLVDISINQYSVHWCGHSKQALHIPYQQFQRVLLQNFRPYIETLIQSTKNLSNPCLALDNIVDSLIRGLDQQYLKPVTFCKIIDLAQELVIATATNQVYQHMELSHAFSALRTEFMSRDHVLEHFNQQCNISNQISFKYSIVLQNQDFNKALKTSASTNATMNSHNQHRLGLQSKDSILFQDFP